MVILSHIIIALLTLAVSTFSWVKPSARIVNASYAMLALTIASGTYLAISSHAHILQTCLTGLAFVAAVSANIIFAKTRLAKVRVKV